MSTVLDTCCVQWSEPGAIPLYQTSRRLLSMGESTEKQQYEALVPHLTCPHAQARIRGPCQRIRGKDQPEARGERPGNEPFRSALGDRQVIRVGVLILRVMEHSVIAHLARTRASTITRRLQQGDGTSPNMHRSPLSFCRALLEEELPWGICELRVIKVSPHSLLHP